MISMKEENFIEENELNTNDTDLIECNIDGEIFFKKRYLVNRNFKQSQVYNNILLPIVKNRRIILEISLTLSLTVFTFLTEANAIEKFKTGNREKNRENRTKTEFESPKENIREKTREKLVKERQNITKEQPKRQVQKREVQKIEIERRQVQNEINQELMNYLTSKDRLPLILFEQKIENAKYKIPSRLIPLNSTVKLVDDGIHFSWTNKTSTVLYIKRSFQRGCKALIGIERPYFFKLSSVQKGIYFSTLVIWFIKWSAIDLNLKNYIFNIITEDIKMLTIVDRLLIKFYRVFEKLNNNNLPIQKILVNSGFILYKSQTLVRRIVFILARPSLKYQPLKVAIIIVFCVIDLATIIDTIVYILRKKTKNGGFLLEYQDWLLLDTTMGLFQHAMTYLLIKIR